MQVRRFIVPVLLVFGTLSLGGAAQNDPPRARIVQNQAEERPARPFRKLQRQRRANQRQAMGVSPRFFDRLLKMPADERQRFLRDHPRFQRLPARQREQIQQRLRRLSQMPQPERDRVLERYRLFDQLPSDKQSDARAIYQRWQRLPEGRRPALLDEYDDLRESTPEDRGSRLDSKEFRDEFSEEERRILTDLSGLLPDGTGLGRR